MDHIHIVKRRKDHTEPYDNHKVYASCYAACLNAHLPKEKAEEICGVVMKDVDTWVGTKESVSSQEIFEQVIDLLAKHNPGASFMYKTHRDIS